MFARCRHIESGICGSEHTIPPHVMSVACHLVIKVFMAQTAITSLTQYDAVAAYSFIQSYKHSGDSNVTTKFSSSSLRELARVTNQLRFLLACLTR